MKFQFMLVLISFTIINFLGPVNLVTQFYKAPNKSFYLNDVLVGTKLNDSIAQVSISNSAIQTAIIPHLKVLTSAVISSEFAVISKGNQTNYLVFSATSVTSKQIVVAIELTKVGNSLFFKNIAGKQIHIWESRGNCLSCKFMQDLEKNRINCHCDSPLKVANDAQGGCDHFTFYIQ